MSPILAKKSSLLRYDAATSRFEAKPPKFPSPHSARFLIRCADWLQDGPKHFALCSHRSSLTLWA
jgi:hypothetical protein